MKPIRRIAVLIVPAVCGLMLCPIQAADEGDFKPLFNGKDLSGWVPILMTSKEKNPDPSADPKNTWRVEDKVIICKGQPNGYIRTEKEFGNYVLKLEWRYKDKPGNSGVLVHTQLPDRVWPKSVEVQLQNASAGSVFAISGSKLDKRNDVKDKSKPVGEWNTYQITCKDGTIEVALNGEIVSKVTGADPAKGYICLQSEGAEIHFRNIGIKELK
jgi:Domain of Unknown Function (DUF1080)